MWQTQENGIDYEKKENEKKKKKAQYSNREPVLKPYFKFSKTSIIYMTFDDANIH